MISDLSAKLPYCHICRHVKFDGRWRCLAFPGGVPDEILSGEFDHRNPWPNADDPQDNGIRFEPIQAGNE